MQSFFPSTDLGSDLGLPISETHQSHPWGVFFTVLGTVLLDFDADACQSPSRAYLLDVTVPGPQTPKIMQCFSVTFSSVYRCPAGRMHSSARAGSRERFRNSSLCWLLPNRPPAF